MPTVVLLGTLDTKAAEYAFVGRDEVAAAAGADLAALQAAADRGAAVTAMARGAAAVLTRLYDEGRCAGALALGGTGGTSIAAQAFRGLPLGAPKVIVSTAASGHTEAYVAESDLVLMPSVVDVAGMNRISARILANAAAAMAGMVTAPPVDNRPGQAVAGGKHVRGDHAVRGRGPGDAVRPRVRGAGIPPDQGRRPDARVARRPRLAVRGAGRDHHRAGRRTGRRSEFEGRNLFVHNPSATLMRTTAEECAELGARLAARVAAGTGPAAVFLPLRGVSAIAVEGGPFHDPAADAALFDAVRSRLQGAAVELVELDLAINDPGFAAAMADQLDHYLKEAAGAADRT